MILERDWIAEALGIPIRLTWTEQRFPLPPSQLMGLAWLELLKECGPGVYIIESVRFCRSNYTVRVGSVTTGTIYQRLREHSSDREITRHRGGGLLDSGLRAFWACTGSLNPEGVEKYVKRVLDPEDGKRYPKMVAEVKVELPRPIQDRLLEIVREPLGLAALKDAESQILHPGGTGGGA